MVPVLIGKTNLKTLSGDGGGIGTSGRVEDVGKGCRRVNIV
jgi:hypothetical protein